MKKTIKVEARSQKWESTFKLLSWWDDLKVREAKVMVVGAGAIGNEVLKNLALLNVGNIIIVDFDKIEYSNLSRSILYRADDADKGLFKSKIAAQRINEINPNVNVSTIEGDFNYAVGNGLIAAIDVIICCVDNRLARLHINRKSFMNKKTWINGAVENLIGQVEIYDSNHQCYECSLTEREWQNVKTKLGCADVAQLNISQGRIPTTPISASIVGALQVQEALKVIHGFDKKIMYDKNFYMEGMSNTMMFLQSSKQKSDCLSHSNLENIHQTDLKSSDSISDLKQYLIDNFECQTATLLLNFNLCTELYDEDAGRSYVIIAPDFGLSNPDFTNDEIANISNKVIKHMTNKIDLFKSYQNRSMKSLGIPAWDILKVSTDNGEKYLELNGDNKFKQMSIQS